MRREYNPRSNNEGCHGAACVSPPTEKPTAKRKHPHQRGGKEGAPRSGLSRYFYYRYWRTEAVLGPLPPHLAEFFGGLGKMGDQAALARLVQSEVLCNWAEEWAAFEGAFATARALRVTYRGLLDGSAQAALEAFTGMACPRLDSFQTRQQTETYETGRKARSRFHRAGRCGEWTRWFSPEQGAAIEAAASRTNIT